MVLLAGGKPKIIKCDEKDGFKLTAKTPKAISKKTKWLILNSPSNPTGAGYTKNEIQDLAKVLIKNKKVHILSDDIYEHIKYDNFNFFYDRSSNIKVKRQNTNDEWCQQVVCNDRMENWLCCGSQRYYQGNRKKFSHNQLPIHPQ